jgi:anti-anti-sigma regulatory factor
MLDPEIKLEYFISEKNGYLVLSMVGSITKATLGVFERAQMELRKCEAQYIVLNFHDITRLDISGVPALVRLQKSLRERPAELRICFLKPDFLRMLVEAGAVRPPELADNLLEALRSFNPNKAAVAVEKKAA